MLRISVLSQRGAAPALPMTAEFGPTGGTIGRDGSNEMILPDPDKHISRVQAQVKCLGGEYFLVDHGGNPTSVNGRPLGKGNVATLHDGDRIEMADWVLLAEYLRAAPSFATAPAPGFAPPPAAPAVDPLGLFGAAPSAPAAASTDPFADLLGSAPAVTPAPAAPPAPARAAADDPFAVFASAASPAGEVPLAPQAASSGDPFTAFGPRPVTVQPAAAPAADPLDPLGLGPAGEASMDGLFGLSPGADPLANSPLADSLQAPSGENLDPLALFGGGAPAAPVVEPVRADTPLLQDAFAPPRAQTVEAPDQPTQVLPASAIGSMEGSWGASTGLAESLGDVLPGARVPRAPARVSVEGLGSPLPQATAPVPVPAAAAAGSDELLQALLRGLGVPGLSPAAITPATAEHLGLMLREAVQGTMELLVARAATKREVRAEVTMIVSKDNNPLKFSPDASFALLQLLQPQSGRGFMPPVAAMRDAYDDLRAHQMGFIAGMRAALSGILNRFQPEVLESRLADKSFLDSVLPANRKAKMWDEYERRYADILREAEDDFHSLFGREFLRAYEEQIERLSGDRPA